MDEPTALDFIKKNQYACIIAVDGGLAAARKLNLKPDFCLGDFDSVNREDYAYYRSQEGIEWLVYPPEKNETDTELALHLAVDRQVQEIHLFGATGTRMDHTLAAIGLLEIPVKAGISCWMIDAHNRITMIESDCRIRRDEAFGTYLSLIPYTEKVTGVTLTGVKYPLQNSSFIQGNSLGISNEITGEEAGISLKEGKLILIESKD